MFEHRFKYQDPLLMWMLYCTNRQNHITGQGLPWECTMIGQLSNDLFKKKLLFHTIFLFSSRLYTIQWFSIWCYFIWVCTHFLWCEHSLFLLPKPHPDQTASVTHRFHVSSMSLTTSLFSFSYFMETQTSWCFIGAVVRGYRRGVSKPRKCCPSFITRLKTKFEKVDHNLNKCLHPGGFKISKKFCAIQILGNIFQFYSAWVKFILWTSEFCHCLLA